jgi:hypothetical protein
MLGERETSCGGRKTNFFFFFFFFFFPFSLSLSLFMDA